MHDIHFQFILMLMACFHQVYAKQYLECQSLGTFNRFVASKSSCSQYIYCDGEDSFAGECLDDNYFNEAAGNCDDPETVACMVGNTENNVSIGILNNGADISMQNNIGIVLNSTSTTLAPGLMMTYSTASAAVTSWSEAPIQPTSNTLDNQQNIFPSNSVSKSPNDVKETNSPQCPSSSKTNADGSILLPNPRNCSTYFICYYGITIPMSCPAQYNFNALLGKCQRQELVQCSLNRPARINCIKGVYDFMPHPDNCEYYYFCANGFLMIFQCPHHFMWHFERRTCVHKSLAKCFTKRNLRELIFGQHDIEQKTLGCLCFNCKIYRQYVCICRNCAISSIFSTSAKIQFATQKVSDEIRNRSQYQSQISRFLS